MEFYYLKKNVMVELKYTPGSSLYKDQSDKQYLAQKENRKNRSVEENIMAKQHFSNGIVYCNSADTTTRVSFCLCSVFPT